MLHRQRSFFARVERRTGFSPSPFEPRKVRIEMEDLGRRARRILVHFVDHGPAAAAVALDHQLHPVEVRELQRLDEIARRGRIDEFVGHRGIGHPLQRLGALHGRVERLARLLQHPGHHHQRGLPLHQRVVGQLGVGVAAQLLLALAGVEALVLQRVCQLVHGNRFLKHVGAARAFGRCGELIDGVVDVRLRVIEREHLRLIELQHPLEEIGGLRIDELQQTEDAEVVVDRVRQRLGDLLSQQFRKVGAIDGALLDAAGEGHAAQALDVLHGPVERRRGERRGDETDNDSLG